MNQNKFILTAIINLALVIFPLIIKAQSFSIGAAVVNKTSGTGGSIGQYSKALVVNGKPAIACYDATHRSLLYVRANDSTGSAWGKPQTIASNSNPIYPVLFKDSILTSNFTHSPYGLDGNGMLQWGKFWYSLARWNSTFPGTHDHDSLVVFGSVNNLSVTDTQFAPWHGRHTVGYGLNAAKDSLFIFGGDLVDYPVFSGDDVWAATQDTVTGRLTWYLVADNVYCLQRVVFGSAITPTGMYVFGGQKFAGITDTLFGDVWRSTNSGVTWSQIATGKTFLAKNLSTNCIYYPADGYTYIISGGVYGNNAAYTNLIYRTIDFINFEQYDVLPSIGRQYPSVTLYKDYIAFGFGNNANIGDQSDLWLYKPANKEWKRVFYSPSIISMHASGFTQIIDSNNNHVLLLSGGSSPTEATNKLYKIIETSSSNYSYNGDTVNPVRANDTVGGAGQYPGFAIIGGYPAVCYYDQMSGEIKYIRATDSSGIN